jgi:signal peptidase II
MGDVVRQGKTITRVGRSSAQLFIGVLAADQISKVMATRVLRDGPVEIVGPIDLTLVHNTGAAFGLLGTLTPVLTILGLLGAVAGWVVATRTMGLHALGWVMIGSGAGGNLLDRLLRTPAPGRGSVIDFIDVGSLPVFNLADIAVCVGASLVVLTVRERSTRPD